jgi:predicted DNA binding CopG/RHH family protein
MDEKMRKLLKAAEKIGMSSEEMEAQRRSFAYGNAHLSNPNVTREMIDSAAEELDPLNAENFEERYQAWVAEKFKRCPIDWRAEFNKAYQHFLDTGELISFHIPESVVEAAKERAAKKGEE